MRKRKRQRCGCFLLQSVQTCKEATASRAATQRGTPCGPLLGPLPQRRRPAGSTAQSARTRSRFSRGQTGGGRGPGRSPSRPAAGPRVGAQRRVAGAGRPGRSLSARRGRGLPPGRGRPPDLRRARRGSGVASGGGSAAVGARAGAARRGAGPHAGRRSDAGSSRRKEAPPEPPWRRVTRAARGASRAGLGARGGGTEASSGSQTPETSHSTATLSPAASAETAGLNLPPPRGPPERVSRVGSITCRSPQGSATRGRGGLQREAAPRPGAGAQGSPPGAWRGREDRNGRGGAVDPRAREPREARTAPHDGVDVPLLRTGVAPRGRSAAPHAAAPGLARAARGGGARRPLADGP